MLLIAEVRGFPQVLKEPKWPEYYSRTGNREAKTQRSQRGRFGEKEIIDLIEFGLFFKGLSGFQK